MANFSLQSVKATVLPFIYGLALLTFQQNSYANKLPDLGSSDLVEYDSITEKQLGLAFTNALHTQYKIYNDLETNQFIRELGHSLASQIGVKRHFRFYIIDDPNINAFAGPDGIIGIHTGLINAVINEDELAAVIAHEISHVTQNHLSRRYEYNSTQGSVNNLAAFIASVLIGMHNPSAGMAAFMGSMGYNLQTQLKNSRIHETEADALGIKLLHRSHYDVDAMANFFGRLSKLAQHNKELIPEILRTHPTSENRLAKAKDLATQLKTSKQIQHPSKLNLIKLRLVKHNQQLTQSKSIHHLNLSNSEQCYLSSLKTTEPKPCLLNKINPITGLSFNSSLLLETTNQQNKSAIDSKANKQILLALELYPENIALLIRYSRYLQNLKQTSKAISLLEQQSITSLYKYELYDELANIYNRTQEEGYMYFSLARKYLELGNPEKSLHFVEKAQELSNHSKSNLEKALKIFIGEHPILLRNIDKTNNN